MRPLTFPNPTVYDGDAQRAVDVSYGAIKVGQKRQWLVDLSKDDWISLAAEQIDEWEKPAPPWPWLNNRPQVPDIDSYITALDRLSGGGHDWGEARHELIEAVGAYCSFCESPMGSALHVEHRLPKSMFPYAAFAWVNFLLACATCNSAKGPFPNQHRPGVPSLDAAQPSLRTHEAQEWIQNHAPANSSHYLWPDYDWSVLPAGSVYPFRFAPYWIDFTRHQPELRRAIRSTPAAGDDEPLAGELLDQFRKGSIGQDRICFVAAGAGRRGRVLAKKYFGVAVLPAVPPGPDPANPDPLYAGAQRVIDLTGLNRIVTASDAAKTVDRRVLNRTIAWLRAMDVKDRLDRAAKIPGALAPVLAMARQTMAATGFWGVWFQVLGAVDLGGGVTGQSLLQDVFPGTFDRAWSS